MINNTTIELVGPGHPDRFADYLAERILEEHLKQDKNAKVAVEILATRDSISLGGEISSNAKIDYEKIVFKAIEEIYDMGEAFDNQWWPNYRKTKIYNHIKKQSPELSKIQKNKIVAGDQGVIYGFYDRKRLKTIEKLNWIMKDLIEESIDQCNDLRYFSRLSKDWKLLYNINNNNLSLSICHGYLLGHNTLGSFTNFKDWVNMVLLDLAKKYNLDVNELIINPGGPWKVPGPLSDTGVVGRKLMIDTFGAGIPHGGGAFCGKDPSKVDKTGILIATFLAKEISNLKKVDDDKEVIVELNYKIGDNKPKAYAYYYEKNFYNNKGKMEQTESTFIKTDISEKIKLTLDEYIKKYKLLDEKWSEHVLNGGVISYINSKSKKK